jgi:hypothetical protein
MSPKVGTTAIQNCLAPLKYEHRFPEEAGPEFRFMSVRHPLERIVSAWAFFCDTQDYTRIGADKTMHDIGYRLGMPFHEFLPVCIEHNEENRHTRKQIDFAGVHGIDLLCPLHALKEAWEVLRARVPRLGINPIEHVRRSQHRHWESCYTPDDRDAAEKEFQADIALYESAIRTFNQ